MRASVLDGFGVDFIKQICRRIPGCGPTSSATR